MTLGSLAATGNGTKRAGAGVPLSHVARAPFDGYMGPEVDTLSFLERRLEDASSGLDSPAAIILETIQAEGGVNAASKRWLQGIAKLARRHGALLIVDDIQVGCGRTGPFFSFEEYGIVPDIVCLSKSLSGFGQPLAVTLMRPELDVWSPGEHNGTFRGNNLAFVTATAALETFWADDRFQREVTTKAGFTRARLDRLAKEHGATVKGRGLILGLSFDDSEIATRASREAFARGMVIETAGPDDEVLKLLPSLTITQPELERGLDIIADSLSVARKTAPRPATKLPTKPRITSFPVGVAS
jgi:diaminobutyrate-2-oxoglutarate transaminase